MTAYEAITARIITALESGSIPWRKEWTANGGGAPRNYATQKTYRGANFISLMCSPYTSNEWLTYNQARDLGAQVRKGEHGSPIIFWNTFKPKAEGTAAADTTASPDGERARGFLKMFTVFNVDQIDGLPAELPFDAPQFDAVAACDAIADGYLQGGPSLAHSGGRAFYSSARDHVQMPPRETFHTSGGYYATLFHELAHSTGHATRLERKLGNTFGSDDYSEEELIAEFAASFLCAEGGIASDDRLDNSAAYIQGWLKVLKGDSRIAVMAAQRAQKASDCILRRTFAQNEQVAA